MKINNHKTLLVTVSVVCVEDCELRLTVAVIDTEEISCCDQETCHCVTVEPFCIEAYYECKGGDCTICAAQKRSDQ